MTRLKITVAALAVGLLVGCSAQTPGPAEALLAAHGLDGMEASEIVEHLDGLGGDDRPTDLMASVRPDELVLSDGVDEVALALPEDEFYLSVAPYADQTHDCFFHSLTTCQGELVSQDVQVTVLDEAGEVVLDEAMTTELNGFVGMWLPRDIAGTIEITADGRTGAVPFSTDDDGATCLTTLQLA